MGRSGVGSGLLLAESLHAGAKEVALGFLLAARFDADGVFTPRSLRVLQSDRAVSLSSSMRVVHGVHGFTEHLRLLAHPAHASRLTDGDEVVLKVTYGTDRGGALRAEPSDLSARKLDDGMGSVDAHESSCGSRGADDLSATTERHFQVVDLVPHRDVFQLHAVAHFHLRARRADDGLADLQSVRSQDVALFAVLVVNEGDARGTVGIVLKRSDDAGNAGLVFALEIDEPEEFLVSSAAMTHAHFTAAAASGDALLSARQALFWSLLCETREVRDRHLASCGSRWAANFHSHGQRLVKAVRSSALLPEARVTIIFLIG